MALIQIQLRRDAASNWASINPTLLSGEIGVETDTNLFKIGNGVDDWNTLGYAGGSGGGSTIDVREDGAIVVTGASNFDFRHGLDVSESVSGRAQVDVDESELSFANVPFIAGRAFAVSNALNPATITANQNNYAPAGIADATILRLAGDAARIITGISSTAQMGRVLLVMNIGSTFEITLAHNNSASLEANKMLFSDGADLVLAPNSFALLVYDGTSQKWRGIGHRAPSAAVPAAIVLETTGTIGTAGTYARAGHSHQLDMSQATPQPLGIGDPGTVGVAPSRGNHTHPTTGLSLSSHTHSLSNTSPLSLGTADAGVESTPARGDHRHPTTGVALDGHTHAGGAESPTGVVQMYAGASAPAGWLMCDGSFVSKLTYASLWNLIGQQFNNGVDPNDGTFRLPDMRGRVPFGVDTASPGNAMGAKFGQKSHTHSQPSHSHGLNGIATSSGSHTHSFAGTSGGPSTTVTVQSGGGANPGNASHSHSTSGTTGAAGDHAHGLSGSALSVSSGVSSTNDPPSLALNFIIKT